AWVSQYTERTLPLWTGWSVRMGRSLLTASTWLARLMQSGFRRVFSGKDKGRNHSRFAARLLAPAMEPAGGAHHHQRQGAANEFTGFLDIGLFRVHGLH